MVRRMRKLTSSAHRSAKRRGDSLFARLLITAGTGAGAYFGAKLGKKHGERYTKAFIEKSLLFVPIPMKSSVAGFIAKRWGEELGVHCGMMLGASVGGALGRRLAGLRLLRKPSRLVSSRPGGFSQKIKLAEWTAAAGTHAARTSTGISRMLSRAAAPNSSSRLRSDHAEVAKKSAWRLVRQST